MFLHIIDTLNRNVVINVYDIVMIMENYPCCSNPQDYSDNLYTSIRLKDNYIVTVDCSIETLIDMMKELTFDSGEGIK